MTSFDLNQGRQDGDVAQRSLHDFGGSKPQDQVTDMAQASVSNDGICRSVGVVLPRDWR